MTPREVRQELVVGTCLLALAIVGCAAAVLLVDGVYQAGVLAGHLRECVSR